jgi:DNA-binding GntR family transcriptional regulator
VSRRQQRVLSTGPTLADQAYRALREDIIEGRLQPGERITERQLAERLGVSPTPVREALGRLEHEHLIERSGTRRIQVAEPSHKRLFELTLIEAALRGVAARLAAENATTAEIAAMRRLYEGFTDVSLAPERALALTRELHASIDRAAHNETLISMIATATAFDWDFRVTTVAEIFGPDRRRVMERHREHGAIIDAIADRDGQLAERLMREHISVVTDAFLQVKPDRVET